MTTSLPVTLTLTFAVDVDAWADAYGLDPSDAATVAADVTSYLSVLAPSDVLPPSSAEWLSDDDADTTVRVGAADGVAATVCAKCDQPIGLAGGHPISPWTCPVPGGFAATTTIRRR